MHIKADETDHIHFYVHCMYMLSICTYASILCMYMAVGQNQWYHFGAGAPPILVYFSEDWDVYWGYGLLTHGHICICV